MIELAVKGKQDFGALYDEYYDKVFVYIYYRARNRQDAEDLTAEAFLRAFEKPYNPELASFSTYIFTVAGNVLKNYYRDSTRYDAATVDAPDFDLSDDFDILGEIISRDELKGLKAALSTLPKRQYTAVYHRYYLDEGFREIGAAIGVSENNARQLHFEAMKKLRKFLKTPNETKNAVYNHSEGGTGNGRG